MRSAASDMAESLTALCHALIVYLCWRTKRQRPMAYVLRLECCPGAYAMLAMPKCMLEFASKLCCCQYQSSQAEQAAEYVCESHLDTVGVVLRCWDDGLLLLWRTYR